MMACAEQLARFFSQRARRVISSLDGLYSRQIHAMTNELLRPCPVLKREALAFLPTGGVHVHSFTRVSNSVNFDAVAWSDSP
jgi:hypothetical protein